ncbi:MAG: Undecaprenyl-phosphate galactose phosphotransferase [Solirubrobacterales bacterium]|nr:Undecaprenyl-phosphate galactose phosphotransferase [Solirubrobacterales bacterium]
MHSEATTTIATTAPDASKRAADATFGSRVARRIVDVVFASLLLLLLAPLLVLVTLAIRLDSRGPALFRQQRLGRGMRPFTVLKFRTMRCDADPDRHRAYVRALITGDAGPEAQNGLYKLAGDDRVTRLGRVLRSSSVDELPQLLNVLRGQMALVGPRPVLAYEVEHYPDWYRRRFAVRPGLTGLWQISGRNERTYEEMVLYDVEYTERTSLGLDLRILLRTVRVVLGRKGAA